MPVTAPAPLPIPGALYQGHAPGEPVPLDVMAFEAGPREFHFYVAGANFGDVAQLIAPELAGARALIFRMPPSLLNPNYWEPHTKAGEDAARARGRVVVTREEAGATWLWRSDSIAPGRNLRDGIDVQVERVDGAFKVAGPDLVKLGTAWAAAGADAQERFEWMAYRPPVSGNGSGGEPAEAQEDVAAFRLMSPGAAMIGAATGDRNVRLAFASRSFHRGCARAALRGYMSRCAGRVVSPPNDKVCDDFLGLAGRGLTSRPGRDFVSKGTAFEFTARPGQSPWPAAATRDAGPDDEEVIIVYYDRVAGIWAVAS